MLLASFQMTHGLIMLAVGLAAGLIGGMLGVGGGILMIPAMVIILSDHQFGDNSFHVYKLAAITTSLVLSVPAVVRHTRAKAVVYRMLPGLLLFAVVGVVGGTFLARTFVGQYTIMLRRIFGGFLEFVVLINILQELRARHGETHVVDRCPLPHRRTFIGLVAGLPAGIIAGLLGIGGGVWAVPAQQQLLGVRIRNAIANSAFMIIFISVATSIAFTILLVSLHDPQVSPWHGYWLTCWLSPGALIGGYFGASLTHRLPVRYLRWAFQAVLAVTGAKLLLG